MAYGQAVYDASKRGRVTAYALPLGSLVHTTTIAQAIWALQEKEKDITGSVAEYINP
jgi:hypothetical protein